MSPKIPTSILTLALILGPGAVARALPPAPALDEAPPAPLLRRSPPSPLEQARMERWYDLWRSEAGAVERSFRDAAEAAKPGSGIPLRPRCLALAGALLDVDRERVLPVPDRAADLHLRRALRHLTRAAVACLTERPYETVGALHRAGSAFRHAGTVLRRYGLVTSGRSRR